MVLCDDALGPSERDWCLEALQSGLASVTGQVAVVPSLLAVARHEAADDPCLVWLASTAERDVIESAAAAASQIVLLLGALAGRHVRRAGDTARSADAWHSVAAVSAERIAVWLPSGSGGTRADPTGELSSALGARRVLRIGRLGSRRAHRQLHRLGRTLVTPACAPQRLERSDGAVRRRNAARAATDALSDLLDEPDVEEFQIRGGESMLVQYAGGKVERRPSPFAADEDLIEAVRFLASYSGDRPQRFDELDPRLDVRVGDRWRLHAEAFVTSPPNVVLRSNMAGRLRLDDLGVVCPELGSVLIEAIAGGARANVVVAAAMGGGKTTLCQALLAPVPDHERIDTIEDTPELRLADYGIHPNTYERLTRDPNQDGHGRHSMADHIRDAKRANASKLVVGEIRGDGCEALLDAMSSGIDGCLVTLHSQPGTGVLEKLVAYACSEGAEPDYARRQIAAAVDLCVWMGRNDAGERVIADVTQLTGIDDVSGVISTACLWALRPGHRWATPVGRPEGRVAKVYESAGLNIDLATDALPAAFAQIIDAPDSATPPVPPASPPRPSDAEASDTASAPASPAPPPPTLTAGSEEPPSRKEPAQQSDAPLPEAASVPDASPSPAQPEVEGPDADASADDPPFETLFDSGSAVGNGLWDPGPLVPLADPPAYEPLISESNSGTSGPASVAPFVADVPDAAAPGCRLASRSASVGHEGREDGDATTVDHASPGGHRC